MSLSDTSFEAMDDLLDGFHNYLGWNYTTQQWSAYISTIIRAAEAAYNADRGELFIDEHGNAVPWPMSHRLCAEQLALELLVAIPNTLTPSQEAMAVLAKVGKTNDELRAAICNVYAWRTSPVGLAVHLQRDDAVPIEPLYQLLTAS
jgi:hypothetical protein